MLRRRSYADDAAFPCTHCDIFSYTCIDPNTSTYCCADCDTDCEGSIPVSDADADADTHADTDACTDFYGDYSQQGVSS